MTVKNMLLLAATQAHFGMAIPAFATPAVETITLVKATIVHTWTPCSGRSRPCATAITITAYDDKGETRLIYTQLQLQKGSGQGYLPGAATAVHVKDGKSNSNLGNQYPANASQLSTALHQIGPNCPATVKVDGHGKVLDAQTPCPLEN